MKAKNAQELLRAEELTITFGGLTAADHVSFHVASGEIMGLIGPNGAGKTTLLNLISGIYQCDSGKVYLDGRDVTKVPSHNRARMGLGRTFQTPRFLHRSSIRDNLMLGTDLGSQIGFFKSFMGKQNLEFEQEVEELMEYAGFAIDWHSDINALPFGQRKRLEIVRSLLAHPKVLLVDEPAAGLNTKELQYAENLLRYAVSKGIGVVLIEHQMDLVMNVCDRIIVLNFGKLIAEGTPKEIASNPAVIEAYLGRKSHAQN
ncbi:ABC transporter ATP-binding protein [Feifania hominis]|uniref:ABC transporter ATP-binding protein n=1 Tax=Feifania hominis TaxID=2763660 RepID=A0A926HTB6_9FIRM|nr:ABC transporter ATP-binding protein [Feifania hominis]MBC8535143.1 ABC transporter ATP-binding protein [Feifania hominis]